MIFRSWWGKVPIQNNNETHRTYGFGTQDHYGKNSFYDLSNITTKQIDDRFELSNLLSYFGRVNYKLFNKYLFTASIRADGASVLSEGNKWEYFPSVAAAWVLSDEDFLSSLPVINNLKLRLSWGKAGNSSVNPYETLTTLGNEKIYYTFGTPPNPQRVVGQVPANLGNPNLTWETTSTYDVGLDVAVLKSRLSATLISTIPEPAICCCTRVCHPHRYTHRYWPT